MVPRVVSIGPNKVSQLERVHNVAVISKLSSLQMEKRDERLQGKKTETGLSLSPLSPSTCLYSSSLCSSGICTPPENAPLSSAAESETNTRLILNLLSCVDSVSQPPRQPDRSNEQTGTSNALAFPGIVFISHLCAKRQKMLEDMEKDFEGGQEADKVDGGGGSKNSGSLDIRFRVEKVQAPLCDWKTATLEYSL
ncbi:hypothetical protein F2Q68_00030047 [Brassica cretica]|uniref:Uncharacterized protein n=1 Tax=Brassica cretica TaxID=69181 RepID=A0A8S9G5K9_BRACR|nr:hypothetical protein F2Q68_00030047 [Brassica cretica]